MIIQTPMEQKNLKKTEEKEEKEPKILVSSRTTFLLTAAAAGIFFLGYRFGATEPQISEETMGQQIREGGYEYINPLLECELGKEYIPKYASLEKKISEKISEISDKNPDIALSLYFRNMNNGPWLGINEKEKFIPASLLKVPIMITYLKEAESDPGLLSKQLTVTEKKGFESVQNIVPSERTETGKTYTISDLLHYSIGHSDNLATFALIDGIPAENFSKAYNDLGVPLPQESQKSAPMMSVKDYATFFRILYNASYLNEPMSEKALKLLSETDFRDGLVAKLPQNVKVAHKFGEYESAGVFQFHDCGIVYAPDYPYLICIMTRGKNLAENEKLVAEISLAIYNEVAENTASRNN